MHQSSYFDSVEDQFKKLLRLVLKQLIMLKPKALPFPSLRDGKSNAFHVPSSKELGFTMLTNEAFFSCLSLFMVQYSDVPGIEEPRHPTPNLVVTLSPTYNPIDEYKTEFNLGNCHLPFSDFSPGHPQNGYLSDQTNSYLLALVFCPWKVHFPCKSKQTN